MAKVYKAEVIVIDHDNELTPSDVRTLLGNVKYLSSEVHDLDFVDIGEWEDENPLNFKDTKDDEIERLFDTCGAMRMAIDEALHNAFSYGQIDGGHHRLWVIDQMVRELKGDKYEEWVERYEAGGEYDWDTGIAP